MPKTSLPTRIAVTALFALMYAVFVGETAALFWEFGETGLALRLAALDAHNFIFFPIAGLLVLIAFWRPTALLIDALARGRIRFGRLVLAACTAAGIALSALIANYFTEGGSRSMFEVAPAALVADEGAPASGDRPARAPAADVLKKMRILAGGEDGLKPYSARCDADWLEFSPTAATTRYCVPADSEISIAECCRAKAAFRTHVNALHARAPSQLATLHRGALAVKCFFLLLLLGIGVLLVRYRPRLTELYGGAIESVSFGLAAGGAVMLLWPLMNATYLETMALLTGSGSSSAYTVVAPLIALFFGIWALLLVFFHLRSYPSQVEYAAKIGGFVAAAVGVFRYEDILAYFSRTLGVGGGVVAIIVFACAMAALIFAVLTGVRPQDMDVFEEAEGAIQASTDAG